MSDYALFFGSFHPVVVHLPIAAVLLAFGLQVLAMLREDSVPLTRAVPWLYGAGFVGGILAALSGWALAGPTGVEAWDNHRWFGVAATLLAGASCVISALPTPALLAAGVGASTCALTAWTGHLGGALVHGEGHFAQYAPDELAERLAPATYRASYLASGASAVIFPDSLIVYPTLIAPVLERSCVPCHRRDYERGGLRLDSYAALAEGGQEGGGVSLAAELWRRVTLPPAHPRYMPTRGRPLSHDELIVLESFLGAGLDSNATGAAWAGHLGEREYGAIVRAYGYDLRPLPYVERTHPPAIELPGELEYWDLQPLYQGHTLLVARLRSTSRDVEGAAAELAGFASNVTQLDLGSASQTSALLSAAQQMPHLTELDLTGSDADDAVLAQLARYPRLERLVLTGTRVSHEGVDHLGALPELSKVYLYATEVSEEYSAELAERLAGRVQVVHRLALPQTEASDTGS